MQNSSYHRPKEVTVKDAIIKGKRMLAYPPVVIIFLFLTAGVVLSFLRIHPAIIVVLYLCAFLLPVLYMCIMVTRWKIWAYTNVRNVHDLKIRALNERLIMPDGHFLTRIEICSAKDKAILLQLNRKFLYPDVPERHPEIPRETIIYHSNKQLIINLASAALLVAGCVYMISQKGIRAIPVWCILGLGIAYFLYETIKKGTHKEPQIILNERGIETSKTRMYAWDKIDRLAVISKLVQGHKQYFITYIHPGGTTELRIDGLETNQTDLNELLVAYQDRFYAQKQ